MEIKIYGLARRPHLQEFKKKTREDREEKQIWLEVMRHSGRLYISQPSEEVTLFKFVTQVEEEGKFNLQQIFIPYGDS